MTRVKMLIIVIVLCYWSKVPLSEASPLSQGYHTISDIGRFIHNIEKTNSDFVQVYTLDRSPAGSDVFLVEIGPKEKKLPAIMVVANMEGNCPTATEAALLLIDLLVGDWQDQLTTYKWFIIPVGNPDGYNSFFTKPIQERFVNSRRFNNDNDDAADEDGPNDLNGDGFITTMRQKHPEGIWMSVPDKPMLMKIADPAKGEKGMYRIFTEGIDDDHDGQFNEDGTGGFNPGRNFPHSFEYWTNTNGPWPASENETRAVLQFAFDHPEIALFLTFGRSNSLLNVPASSKKSSAAQETYRLPEHFAKEMGIDPETEFTMAELITMGKEHTGYEDLTEDMVLQFLGLGVAVNPDQNDLLYWNELSKHYHTFLEHNSVKGKRLPPSDFSPGCIEEWAYFQFGVPSFSLDFWTLPVVEDSKNQDTDTLTIDDIASMSNDEFIKLDPRVLGTFLKENNAPSEYTAEMVIEAVKSGMLTTEKLVEYIASGTQSGKSEDVSDSDKSLLAFNPGAFLEWQPYQHPTLGEIEIGGKLPFYEFVPPFSITQESINTQLPFIRDLVSLLPEILIDHIEIELIDRGIWKVQAWIKNNGFLPFPTYQGKRCKRPTSTVVTLDPGKNTILDGRKRIVLDVLPGSGGVQKVMWLIHAPKGKTITIAVDTISAGYDKQIITLREGVAS